jgi:hypothetical protein
MGDVNKTFIQKIFNSMGRKKVLIYILLFVVVCLIGVFIYLITLDKDSDPNIPKEKDYYSEEYGVKFEYPGNWVVLETPSDDPETLVLRLGESEDSTNFIFDYRLESTEISRCVYSDTKEDTSDIEYKIDFGNSYTEIDEKGEYRRGLSPYSDNTEYIICKKDLNGEYTTWASGYIRYENVDLEREDSGEMLDILDKISLSLKYTGNLY